MLSLSPVHAQAMLSLYHGDFTMGFWAKECAGFPMGKIPWQNSHGRKIMGKIRSGKPERPPLYFGQVFHYQFPTTLPSIRHINGNLEF